MPKRKFPRIQIIVFLAIGVMLGTAAGAAGQTLVAVNDSYAVPMGGSLMVEAFGVLNNDTVDGQNAGEAGATATLVSSVSHGVLECGGTALELCTDGSFTYTPGASFTGTDSFTYEAAFGGATAQATVTLTACTGGPDVFTCWQESAYTAKLAELGFSTFQEGFEGAAWAAVREPNTASGVTSQGIRWTSNYLATNEITTGTGPARSGTYGLFDPNHGFATGTPQECDINNPPAHCLFYDGWTGTRTGGSAFQAAGGYFTGTTGANIAVILDGGVQIGLGRLPDPDFYFLGVIRTAAFSTFQFREIDGKVGQERMIFADDFTFATGSAAINHPPTADAGPDQMVNVTDTVTLDGSGSADPDTDPLSYSWSFVSKPAGSTAALSDPAAMGPSFTADLPGTYVVKLVVNDGQVDSLPDTVTISTHNTAPTADAGPDQMVYVTNSVSLDSSGSNDPDGDPLSYSWSFVSKPAGSTAALSDPAAMGPSFTADLPGTYVVKLVVNDGQVDSLPDTVTISTQNSPPVANAGPDQTVLVLDPVTLDGSGSDDVDGDPLSYSWSFFSKPAGSTAALSDPSAVGPTFTTDLPGTYVVKLVVNDGQADSLPDTVIISTQNLAPVADAGVDQTIVVLESVILDGSSSYDGDGDTLNFNWSFIAKPTTSTATLDTTDAVHPTFVADQPGIYIVQLIVNDGIASSDPDTIKVTARNAVTPTAHITILLLSN